MSNAAESDPLSPDQRTILEAMGRLEARGNTAVSVAAEAGLAPPVVGRLLREMEVGLNPRPVQSDVDEGQGQKVWFRTPAAEDYFDDGSA